MTPLMTTATRATEQRQHTTDVPKARQCKGRKARFLYGWYTRKWVRASHVHGINVDLIALGEEKIRHEIAPLKEDLFMVFSAVQARKFPFE